MPRTTQFRTYMIRQGLMDEWVRRWREEVVPLRQEFGFQMVGAWLDRERDRFLCVIVYDGPETFEEINDRYWASPKRRALGLEVDDYIVGWDMRTVDQVT